MPDAPPLPFLSWSQILLELLEDSTAEGLPFPEAPCVPRGCVVTLDSQHPHLFTPMSSANVR